jgi:hypothetical protein
MNQGSRPRPSNTHSPAPLRDEKQAWCEVFHQQQVFLVVDCKNQPIGFTSRFVLPGFEVRDAGDKGKGLFANTDQPNCLFHIYGEKTSDAKSVDHYRYDPNIAFYKDSPFGRPPVSGSLLTKWAEDKKIPSHNGVFGYGLGHFLLINEPSKGTCERINSMFYKYKVVLSAHPGDQLFIQYYNKNERREGYNVGNLTRPDTLETLMSELDTPDRHPHVRCDNVLYQFPQRRMYALNKEQDNYIKEGWLFHQQAVVNPDFEVTQATYTDNKKEVSYTLRNKQSGRCQSTYFPVPRIRDSPVGRCYKGQTGCRSWMQVWPGDVLGSETLPMLYNGKNNPHYNFFPEPLPQPQPIEPIPTELVTPCIRRPLCPDPSEGNPRDRSALTNISTIVNNVVHTLTKSANDGVNYPPMGAPDYDPDQGRESSQSSNSHDDVDMSGDNTSDMSDDVADNNMITHILTTLTDLKSKSNHATY